MSRPSFQVVSFKTTDWHERTGSFLSFAKVNALPSDAIWYTRNPMWKNVRNVVGSLMKCLISGTSLEKVPKRLSNNNMRKTTVKKLKATGVAESTIIKANGHTSTAGLRSYGPSDQGELRGMSNAIDSSSCLTRNSTEPAVGSSITSSSPYNRGNYFFHNCQGDLQQQQSHTISHK